MHTHYVGTESNDLRKVLLDARPIAFPIILDQSTGVIVIVIYTPDTKDLAAGVLKILLVLTDSYGRESLSNRVVAETYAERRLSIGLLV